MTTIQLLQAGIQNGNWADVCAAYEQLTGQSIPSPSIVKEDGIREALARIAEIATAYLDKQQAGPVLAPPSTTMDESEDESETVPVKEAGTLSGNIYGIEQRIVTQQVVTEKEREANRKFAQEHPREPRPPHRPVQVTCTECNRPYESPVAVPKGIGSLCPTCLKSRRR